MKNDSRERVAIVILNWNGKEMMRRFLPSVIQYSKDEAVVWVADNASTDGSMEMLSLPDDPVEGLLDGGWPRRPFLCPL